MKNFIVAIGIVFLFLFSSIMISEGVVGNMCSDKDYSLSLNFDRNIIIKDIPHIFHYQSNNDGLSITYTKFSENMLYVNYEIQCGYSNRGKITIENIILEKGNKLKPNYFENL